MNSQFIDIIQLLFLIILNLLFSYFLLLTMPTFRQGLVRNTMTILLIIAYSFISFYALRNAYYNDGFTFEVSPQRELCLKEQVLPISKRSCGCCGKGTVGGYPARYIYKDLIGSDDSWNWNRVDAYDEQPSITPPTAQCGVYESTY